MLSEANFNLVTGRWDAKTNLQTRRPGRKETPMRDLIETEGARKHSYWTIESVVLSFEDSFFPVRPNTLILRVEHAVKDWSEPFRVRPIFSGADGKQRYVLSIFWIDVWSCAAKSREEALAEITSAAPTGTPVVLDEIAFTTQFSHFQAVVSVNSLRPLNALSVLEKLNEFTWMQCSGFRPAWYSDALHGAAFDTEDAFAPPKMYRSTSSFCSPVQRSNAGPRPKHCCGTWKRSRKPPLARRGSTNGLPMRSHSSSPMTSNGCI